MSSNKCALISTGGVVTKEGVPAYPGLLVPSLCIPPNRTRRTWSTLRILSFRRSFRLAAAPFHIKACRLSSVSSTTDVRPATLIPWRLQPHSDSLKSACCHVPRAHPAALPLPAPRSYSARSVENPREDMRGRFSAGVGHSAIEYQSLCGSVRIRVPGLDSDGEEEAVV